MGIMALVKINLRMGEKQGKTSDIFCVMEGCMVVVKKSGRAVSQYKRIPAVNAMFMAMIIMLSAACGGHRNAESERKEATAVSLFKRVPVMNPVLIMMIIMLLAACGGRRNADTEKKAATTPKEEIIRTDEHNARNSLDWPGTYQGILPCEDCEGIETEITIAKDGTFVKKMKYAGKDTGQVVEEKGVFNWDDTGSIIILEGTADVAFRKYFVGENVLILLDAEGNRIVNESGERYILKKI